MKPTTSLVFVHQIPRHRLSFILSPSILLFVLNRSFVRHSYAPVLRYSLSSNLPCFALLLPIVPSVQLRPRRHRTYLLRPSAVTASCRRRHHRPSFPRIALLPLPLAVPFFRYTLHCYKSQYVAYVYKQTSCLCGVRHHIRYRFQLQFYLSSLSFV